MKKITFEISPPALQATFVCFTTLVLAGGLIWAYVGKTPPDQLVGHSGRESSRAHSDTLIKTGLEKPSIEQAGNPWPVEPSNEVRSASIRSNELGIHPKTLIGPLSTNLANLVGRFQKEPRESDRANQQRRGGGSQ